MDLCIFARTPTVMIKSTYVLDNLGCLFREFTTRRRGGVFFSGNKPTLQFFLRQTHLRLGQVNSPDNGSPTVAARSVKVSAITSRPPSSSIVFEGGLSEYQFSVCN